MLLSGCDSFSLFRRACLETRLQKIYPGLRLRSVTNFFVLSAKQITDADLAGIAEVLNAQNHAPEEIDDSVWVLPRFGVISPWASKTEEILRNAGFQVTRIEQGWRFEVSGILVLPEADRTLALHVLYDPMTQNAVLSQDKLFASFLPVASASLRRIGLGKSPRQNLQSANRELNLALSDEEINYLVAGYAELERDPTDAELMMFAQVNSEHCRHKVFNARWRIDGVEQPYSLFEMIKHTHARSPQGVISAYRDNAAVLQHTVVERFYADARSHRWSAHAEPVAVAIKCETHNHPTAISPFAGASTGCGGEIRDEAATGRGAKPKAGLVGFSVSNLHIPGLARPWEKARELSPRLVSAFAIMQEGPLGSAAFNNEFGRPTLCGYFRSFEYAEDKLIRGYDKPIMLAGGLGNLHINHVEKRRLQAGDLIVVLGGPGMRVGLGGGSASSVFSGHSPAARDFDSVQRANPQMQRRCQEVIDHCWSMGTLNPILSLHDVGAGGLANAISEILHDSGVGGQIELRSIPNDESGMSPMQIWCNEAQERYVLGIHAACLPEFEEICQRERCPHAVVGIVTTQQKLEVNDVLHDEKPIDIPMALLFGSKPGVVRDAKTIARVTQPFLLKVDIEEALLRVLQHPTVASKSFLITIADRSVGGLCARDQMVGAFQMPVADCALTLCDFSGYAGEAMAIGERMPVAMIDAAASARMAVAEALMNIAAAPIAKREDIKLSANWMAAVDYPGEDAELYAAVQAVAMEFCPALGLSIPVGKDSLFMQAVWSGSGGEYRVVSPVSLIVSAFAPVADVRSAVTPELRFDLGETVLVMIDLGGGNNRLGASILAQCFGQLGSSVPDVDNANALGSLFDSLQKLNRDGLLLAYHDRSDGGVLITLLEMAFATRCGLNIQLETWAEDLIPALFNEEIGAVIQIRLSDLERVRSEFGLAGLDLKFHIVAQPRLDSRTIRLLRVSDEVAIFELEDLLAVWHETSHAMQRLRDNPQCADQELRSIVNGEHALRPQLNFDPADNIAAPFIACSVRPKIAVLREQGISGQVEMAAAFTLAGFDAFDVHMSDLLSVGERLSRFDGLAVCSGFSYGDVLGAGRGWAISIRRHGELAEQFQRFFHDPRKFTLGVCNGCQMLSELKDWIPGAEHWPQFKRNLSERFEARLSLVEVLESPSLFFRGMKGSRLPIVVSHGEGRADFTATGDATQVLSTLRYVTAAGVVAEHYPANPNGSAGGCTGFTNRDGRVTLSMPHPERVHRSVQFSWCPRDWQNDSPWMRMFQNARAWLA